MSAVAALRAPKVQQQAPTKKKEIIQVITRDNIRKLRAHDGQTKLVPEHVDHTSPYAVVLTKDEFSRIKNEATLLTPAEELRRTMDSHREKLDAMEAAKMRKMKMEEYERKRAANAKLTEAEIEAKDKNNYLLAKAQMQLDEDEDDIKHMNELILYAKCVAIRDAQLDEKKYIEKQRKEEEQRLDQMMEAERIAALKKIEERAKARQAELRQGASVIRKQIEERHEAALLEQERKDQETKQILKQIRDVAQQELEEKRRRIETQRKLMQNVAKANLECLEQKKHQKLKDLEEDRKVLQYLLDKEKREIELDKINEAKKAEREKELARLRAMQEKSFDKQAQQDALRAKRAAEAYEREWRRKEKETAEKLAQQERMLKEERIKQQMARDHAIAVEAHKMKEEFYAALDRQKEVEERLKQETQERHKRNKQYSIEVQSQIREKEQWRRKEREDFFLEGIRQEQSREEKKMKIEAIKLRKLNQLRGLGVPEKYCVEIQRKMDHEKPRLVK